MTTLQQILITGVLQGAIYALLALGFSLIYGAARIINLTHTAFFMVAAYFIFIFFETLGINLLASIAIAVVLTTAISTLLYKGLIERIQEHEEPVLLITIALALVLQQVVLMVYGAVFRGIHSYIPGYVELLSIRVSNQHWLTLIVLLACMGAVSVFLYRSRVGLAIRVTAQDKEIANLMGINVGRMCMIAVAVGTALAAIAGAMVAPIAIVEPRMWVHPLTMVLAVVILGGLGSIKGSIIGALILGITESAVVNILPMGAYVKGSFALAIMLIVLLIRPEGLFGVSFEEERL